jgi:hypothetical protein
MFRIAVLLAVLIQVVTPQPRIQAAAAPQSATAFPALSHLRPGGRPDIQQEVPVTVVFVGLEPGGAPTGIDADRLLAPQLPRNQVGDRTTRYLERTALPRRIDNWYDQFLEPSHVGITYRYDYRVVFADSVFEDQFFGFLASIARGPIPLGTVYQQAYAAHPLAAQSIAASYVVDATAAEWWLAAHAGPLLGIDTSRPTVFFVNWFGRPDFRFHTYAFLQRPPDFPFPFGFTHEGQMVAWGGSPATGPYGALGREARVWFYDVSAGPSYASVTWLLEPADVTGDGITDERMAPIWEYGTSHWYRPFDDLTADLAKLLRFVAVDMLFGSTPIYDPAISEPLLADRIELDLNLFAGRPDRDPAATLRTGDLPSILTRLDPTRQFSVDARRHPLEGTVGAAFDCQQSAFTDQPRSCFGNRAQIDDDPATSFHDGVFFDLDLYFANHSRNYLDGTRYELPLAFFDVPEERTAVGSLRGLASSRAPNLQAWTYVWMTDSSRAFLDTDTRVLVHEVGHHLGLSHVHDTYDPGLDQDLGADGAWLFLFSGIESFTVMSYLQNTDEFGQFDRDHLARWQIAARLDNANRILGQIERSPRGSTAAALVRAADAKAGDALAALDAWDLATASAAMAVAYRLVLDAAAFAGIAIEPYSAVADQRGAGVLEAATDPRRLTLPMPRTRVVEDGFRYLR